MKLTCKNFALISEFENLGWKLGQIRAQQFLKSECSHASRNLVVENKDQIDRSSLCGLFESRLKLSSARLIRRHARRVISKRRPALLAQDSERGGQVSPAILASEPRFKSARSVHIDDHFYQNQVIGRRHLINAQTTDRRNRFDRIPALRRLPGVSFS